MVKPAAAGLLEATFARRSWRGELIAMSGNTDCYQPLPGPVGYGAASAPHAKGPGP